jgi:hypothetical protein
MALVSRGADPVAHLPAGVLPKYVQLDPAGGGRYVTRARFAGGMTVALGPFACPAEAHRAMVARLAEVGREAGWRWRRRGGR